MQAYRWPTGVGAIGEPFAEKPSLTARAASAKDPVIGNSNATLVGGLERARESSSSSATRVTLAGWFGNRDAQAATPSS